MRKELQFAAVFLMVCLLAGCTPAADSQPASSGTETAATVKEESTAPEGSGQRITPMPQISPAAAAAPTEEPAAPATEITPEPTPEPTPEVTNEPVPVFPAEPEPVSLDPEWEFAENSVIHTGSAMLYRAQNNRKNITVGVNAGHGTAGGESVRTLCHPDGTPKVTGGSTAEGSVTATAVSSGMTFFDGTPEYLICLREAQILKEMLLDAGYDVLMLRDAEDVQLDNVARTVICNNTADCHIAIHWDGDGLDYDKGSFYMSVPDAIKGMYPVSGIWQEDDRLGDCLINGLSANGFALFEGGSMPVDLTQTSYSKVPSVDIELGNAASAHDEESLRRYAAGLFAGITQFFE